VVEQRNDATNLRLEYHILCSYIKSMAGDYQDDEFEWDLDKAEVNLKTHGAAFEDAKKFEWESCLGGQSAR